MEVNEDNVQEPRRSQRRIALTEINQDSTPKKDSSPDERVIVGRGQRKKPIIWSPFEYNRRNSPESNEITPDKKPRVRTEAISSRLRRRLIMSPTKSSYELGQHIAKKLKALEKDLDKNLNKTI